MPAYEMPEHEWKILRGIRDRALRRFCARALYRAGEVIAKSGRETDPHRGFLSLHRLLDRQNEELAALFDDWRRSTALFTLAGWARAGIITEDEFEKFSENTKELVNFLVQVTYFTGTEP